MAFVFENTAPRFEFEDASEERFVFEEDKPSAIAKTAKYVGEQVVATGELALSLGSGMAMYIPSKIAGAVGSALGADPRQVEEWFQTEFLPVYQPRTVRGKQAVAPIEKLFEWGMLPAEKIGENVATELIREIDSGATLDTHAFDQILPYMVLARDNEQSSCIVKEIRVMRRLTCGSFANSSIIKIYSI